MLPYQLDSDAAHLITQSDARDLQEEFHIPQDSQSNAAAEEEAWQAEMQHEEAAQCSTAEEPDAAASMQHREAARRQRWKSKDSDGGRSSGHAWQLETLARPDRGEDGHARGEVERAQVA